MRLRGTALVAVLTLAACSTEPRPLRVVRIHPSASDEPARLFLNQEIAVYFSEPIDAMSITGDTVRVVDERGIPVEGRLSIGSRSVSFLPIPPVTPGLDDGSFRPGASYRLEVVGFPRLAVRSTGGQVLERTVTRAFRAVSAAPADLLSVFLPVGIGTEPLMLQVGQDLPLRMAADAGKLQLHFSLPLLPSSVTPAAFQFRRIVSTRMKPEELEPADVRIVPRQVPRTRYYGCSVEITFRRDLRIDPGDLLYLILATDEHAVRDYRGRAIAAATDGLGLRGLQPIQVFVDPGDRVRVRDVDFERIAFLPMDDMPLGFEVRGARVLPQCRVEAGSGSLGWFRPKSSTTIIPGQPFDRGDGTPVTGDGDFEFYGIEIPPGVTVTVRSLGRVSLRATRSIRILGQLRLETPLTQHAWARGATPLADQLLMASNLSLVAGGDIVVRGGIHHWNEAEQGSPVTLLSGGDIVLEGRLPPQCALAVAAQRAVFGVAESPIRLRTEMTPGLPPGVELAAGAWSEWLTLPPQHSGAIDVRAVDLRGDVELAVQVSPDRKVLRPPVPLPLDAPLQVPMGAELRFRIEARARSGQLPSFAASVELRER